MSEWSRRAWRRGWGLIDSPSSSPSPSLSVRDKLVGDEVIVQGYLRVKGNFVNISNCKVIKGE